MVDLKSHSFRKPLGSSYAHEQRQRLLFFGVAVALGLAALLTFMLAGCGGGNGTFLTPTPAPGDQLPPPISAPDVQNIVNAAVASVNVDMVVAVVDRAGFVLGVYRTANAPTQTIGNYGQTVNANDVAVALARTGAFFSNDQAPLSSRTVRYLSGIHLPPGVSNQPNADLYGIENTNRGCTLVPTVAYQSLLPPATALAGGPGAGILTGKADVLDSDPNAVNPGGLPIFDQTSTSTPSIVLGGIGVVTSSSNLNVAEYAAIVGSNTLRANSTDSFGLKSIPPPGAVFIGGIQLPFVEQTTLPSGFTAGPVAGTGSFVPGFGPVASAGQPPDGDLITPANGPKGGLTAAQVTQVLDQAEATAMITRAAIRLPLGSHAEMVIAVADLDGTFIGLRRMPDATIFSVDVAASKARNMTYFNSSMRTTGDLPGVPIGTAVTNRTISFGAMPLYPPGIGGNPPPANPGPFYNLFLQDTASPCTQGAQAPTGVFQSGIVFFPGSAGLYINGTLVGALGVSGDGVDQDDFVTHGGTAGFEAPLAIRADQIFDENVRLPYFKFPRDPTNP